MACDVLIVTVLQTPEPPKANTSSYRTNCSSQTCKSRGRGRYWQSKRKYSLKFLELFFFFKFNKQPLKNLFLYYSKISFHRTLSGFIHEKGDQKHLSKLEGCWQKASSFLSNKQVWKIKRLTMKWNGWYDKRKRQLSCMHLSSPDSSANASLFSSCQYGKSTHYTEWKAKSIHSDSSQH